MKTNRYWLAVVVAAFMVVITPTAQAANPGYRINADVKDYEEAWGLQLDRITAGPFRGNGMVRVELIASTAVGNLFWPGQTPVLPL